MTITESNRVDQQSIWSKSVVKVGRGGRGFIVETDRREKLVITAAHCVPHSFERTYRRLDGEIGKRARPVTVECLFVDPVADLAVLGAPDDDEAFDAFFKTVPVLPVGTVELSGRPTALPQEAFLDTPRGECDAWLFSLVGEWFRCHVVARSRAMMTASTADCIQAGMSGSPIVDDNGRTIGVVASDVNAPQPCLATQLPGWLLKSLGLFPRIA
jgi:S1-C subfamily serine protease